MGRNVPFDHNISLIASFLYFSFSIVGLAASMSIIIGLCSLKFRKKSPTICDPFGMTSDLNTPSQPSTRETTAPASPEHQPCTSSESNTKETSNDDTLTKELPLPPAMQAQSNDSKISVNVKRATSERRLSFNMSMKLPKSFSMARNWDHNNNNNKENNDIGKKAKLKPNESVWMKTIILGEKCNPDEEEDAIIYEGKGKKISAYHPKRATSISLSRQWSNIDPDALSVPHVQSNEDRINNL
ncbi:hypothetical protein RIF29_05797 [Crotalaria pallida]|uniref:Uncharacterized protein n=1 Tax=Crotalaria pallida TaxID=3830 RepID=A0AAN9J2R1_CROPI